MYKLCSIAATGLALAGCAAAPTETTPAAPVDANIAVTPQVFSTPVKTVDMTDFPDDRVRCEDLTRPGSRIVVAQRCRPINEEALADQIHQVRREQDELDRIARDRENRRGTF
jgi:hypothetical protein